MEELFIDAGVSASDAVDGIRKGVWVLASLIVMGSTGSDKLAQRDVWVALSIISIEKHGIIDEFLVVDENRLQTLAVQ